MKDSLLKIGCLAAIATLTITGSLRAQDLLEIDEVTAEPEEEDIINLSPFEVVTTDDRGYLSTNAVSGTSMNMLIRDLPIPLEVVNQEFIEDLQATDLDEALNYSAGVYTRTFQNGSGANASGSAETSPSASVNVNNPFANAISIRGYSVPNQQRFGFRVGGIAVGEGFSVVLGGATDMVNARRLEVVRGPASLLYGVNVLSGIVNIMPKRPLSEPRYSASFSIGSDGFRRATADATGPIIEDRLNYRLMGAYEERDHYTQFRRDEKEYISAQIEYRITPKTRLLAEVQYADQIRYGTGFQYFEDRNNNIDFRNQYGEFIEWGREDLRPLMARDPSDPRDVFLLRKSNPPVPYIYGNLGDEFRISGPDTYISREEFNAMVLLEMEPIENLNIELGGYYTDIKQESLDVNGAIVTDFDVLGIRPDDTAPFIPVISQAKLWVRHPEVLEILGGSLNPSGGRYGLDEAVGFSVSPEDVPNWTTPNAADNLTTGGVGDIFVIPDRSTRVDPNLPDDGNTTTTKFARYYWMARPTESESLQLRLRAAYSFDTPVPFTKGGTVKHTIIGGLQHTEDNLLVVSGNPDASDLVTPGQLERIPGTNQLSLGRMDEDPYLLRQSIYDFTPIRYNGEPLAIPGSLSTSVPDMGQPLTTYVNNTGSIPGAISGFNIARSGWRDVEAEYTGMYGIYQAQFFNDKITLIAGLREDTYNVTETESLRLLDGTPQINPDSTSSLTDLYFGSQTFATLPFQISGTERYTEDKWIADLPTELNQEIQREVDLFLEGLGPQGTRRDLFEEDQTFLTRSAGLSYRIMEDLSMYITYSEGVFPNQGLRDGLDRPIPAEQTVGKEIGFKFDFFDGRISGTISFFQLTRENATWNFAFAPVPRRWMGGRLGPSPEDVLDRQLWGSFDAISASGDVGPKAQIFLDNGGDINNYQRFSYGVHEQFLREAWNNHFDTPLPESVNLDVLRELSGYENFDWLMTNDFGMGGQRENAGKVASYYFADVTRDFEPGKHVNPEGVDIGLLFKEAFDAALLAKDFDGLSVFWRSSDRNGPEGAGNNPSNSTGALVTFEEETHGVDGQIIFSPTDNYQILFTYSYQEREVVGNGFNLAPLIDPITGQKIPGTKYDRWVFALGEENFTDITDPTTFTGEGVNGLDLSFVPNWNFSLWNKYRFSEGPLERLELAAGVKYYGEAPSSVPIGGRTLAENQFPTPPTPERFEFDASIGYRFDWLKIGWRVALKVNNVLDDRVDEEVVEYADPGGPIDPVVRRTRVLYAPRTYRLIVSAEF